MESVLAFKQVILFLVMVHSQPVSGMISQSIKNMSSQCFFPEKWSKQMLVIEEIQLSDSPMIGYVLVKKLQRRELLADMKPLMADLNSSGAYGISSGTTDTSTSIISIQQR